MSKANRTERVIPLDRIFLNQENPRHEPCETQSQVIEWMCSNEEVPQLAQDIVQHGLSPLDRFGVVLDHDPEGVDATYIAAEGNRRLCALKLLNDPDLAPPEKKNFFEKLAGEYSPIEELPCVIFEDQNDLDLWLKRRHHGEMGGIGQKDWNADQKSRHSGANSRNWIALAFLDYAEQEKLISKENRRRRLTTVQRFLSNSIMRETMGLDVSDPDNVALSRNRTDEDFKLLSRQLINDMLAEDPKVHSRQNKAYIDSYARELGTTKGQSHERLEEAEPIVRDPGQPKPKKRPHPGKTKPPQYLPWRKDIESALKSLGNWKLQTLYHSLCKVLLKGNTPLLAVGVWSFFETLTASAGRNPKTDFHSFLSQHRLIEYGLGTKNQINPLRDAAKRIRDYGNTTKHHDTAAAFNSEQLYNDLDSLGETILKVIDDAIARKRCNQE